jgi:hypothetical protein
MCGYSEMNEIMNPSVYLHDTISLLKLIFSQMRSCVSICHVRNEKSPYWRDTLYARILNVA